MSSTSIGAFAQLRQQLAPHEFELPESLNVPEIENLLNKSLLVGGKRMRPMFTILMGRLFGVPVQKMMNCAVASELVHAAFLAHDDVIDEAKIRRGIPTINARSSNRRAILAGDALLAYVCQMILREDAREIMSDLATTIRETVEGEWIQMESIRVAPVTLDHVERIGFKKTGALLVWCAKSASYVSGQSPMVIEYCEQMATLLGVAFQLIDDVIDFEPTSQKSFAKDFNEGLVNSVMALMMQRDPKIIAKFMSGYQVQSKEDAPWSDELLQECQSEIKTRALNKIDFATHYLDLIYNQIHAPSSDQALAKSQLQELFEVMKDRKV